MFFANAVEFIRDPAPAHDAAMDMAYHRRGFAWSFFEMDRFKIIPPLLSMALPWRLEGLRLCARSDAKQVFSSFSVVLT